MRVPKAWNLTQGSFLVSHAMRQDRLTLCGRIICPSMLLKTSVLYPRNLGCLSRSPAP